MPYEDRLTVLALHKRDADEWKLEHPELSEDARIVIADGRGWDALRGIVVTSLSLGRFAAESSQIGSTEAPQHVRLALNVAEHRRRHVLKEVA